MEINEENFENSELINDDINFSDNNEFLLNLFSKLYQSYIKDKKIFIPNNHKFLSQLKKKLFSNIKITSKDEPSIVNLLQDKASKISNFNPDIINKFQNLYQKLIKRRSLTKRWEILYLLNSLSKLPHIYHKLDIPENDFLQKKIWELANDITGNDIIDTENKFLNCKKLNSYDEIIDPTLDKNNKEILSVINTNKSSLNITEKDIVTDLLYVLVGIDGKFIKYNKNKDSYHLIENIPWEENIYDIVNLISETGWLFHKIKKYILYYKSSISKSLYIQSFIFAIEKELDEYYKLISLFKKMNSNDLSNDISHIPLNDNFRAIKKLNLKNLLMGIIPSKEKLKWILTCCESVHTLHGSAILSQIYSYVTFLGNQSFLNNVLNEVIKPFIGFILNWIKYGEIQDSYNEFFIKIKNDVNGDNIWKDKYELIFENIPNFIKRDFVLKIFEIGKCIHFIKYFCKEKYNLNNLIKVIQCIENKYFDKNEFNDISNIILEEESIPTEENSQINEEDNNIFLSRKFISEFDFGINPEKIKHEKSSYESVLKFISYIFSNISTDKILNISILDEIMRNIDLIHNLINKDLVRIFFQKFKFLENIDSLNKYLLLGQGDMIQNLMESLYTELQKPGNTIYKYVLQSVLESAINSTNARYNDKDCLNKLSIKLLKALPGDIGWDVFCLEYNIELPLSVVISSRNILDYQKMFIFLIRIKRIEYAQNLEWRKIMTYSHDISNDRYPFFKSKIKKSLKFNQQIMHFITSLHNYLTLEVLETQYKKLIKKIKNINSINELILAHNNFINSIKDKCFLDNKNNSNIIIYKKIISIFDIIQRFRTAQDVLISTLLQKFNDLDEEEKSLNSDNVEENEGDINYNRRIEESNKQINFLYDEFQDKIIDLINYMKNFGLKYLAMKLDFNYYYLNIESDKEGKEQQMLIEKITKEQNRIRIEKQKQKYNLYQDIEYNENSNININNYSIQNNNEDINEYHENNNNINENEDNNININNNNNNYKNNYYYNKYKNEEEEEEIGDGGMEEDEKNDNNHNYN